MLPDLKLNCNQRKGTQGLLVECPAWKTGRGVVTKIRQDTCIHGSSSSSTAALCDQVGKYVLG
jgi:hypothetical protein